MKVLASFVLSCCTYHSVFLYIMLLSSVVFYVTSTVCDSSVHFSLLLFMLPCQTAHCEALELHCFLGKMPQASVQEKCGLGACRLKYLQWRHAMASFIRCLTSWTIKLGSMLNWSKILLFFFFMTMLDSLFSLRRDYVSVWNCSDSFIDLGSTCGSNWKPHIYLTPYEKILYQQGAKLYKKYAHTVYKQKQKHSAH